MNKSNDIDDKIKKLIENTKGNYITQGTSFNKKCPRQIELLKFALENSVSFSGLVKEMLALRLNDTCNINKEINSEENIDNIKETFKKRNKNINKDIGNFI